MNLAVTHHKEQTIKKEGDIPARERLVVMVAAGLPPSYPTQSSSITSLACRQSLHHS